ncbi:hypothetical protein [Pontiella agarivorans]|uniref:DUF4405 domain-containing protein n=1 Tax=Pontiella agarivorans TaxID=3038953 RepID=A0ABU5MWU0_9BACT|nr:hypothetical protein [Pontiella agarivorans]MDZ8118684.1 hypothetical protein [Pontiella agarivorans]
MKSRALVSLFIALMFIGMAVTGVLSYLWKYNQRLSAFHVIFSFSFLVLALFHIFNNFKPLKNYATKKKTRFLLPVLLGVVAVYMVGIAYSLFPFKQIVGFGKTLRQQDEIRKKTEYVITTKSEAAGRAITIDFRAGPEYMTKRTAPDGRVITSIPQIAVWLEDADGSYLETLYVSGKSATGNYSGGKNRRPGALPAWSHARGIKSADGLFMPDAGSAVVDGLSAATPLTSFSLHSRYPEKQNLKLRVEVNKSFDDNEYFNKENITDDPVYLKNPNGQPSLIYTAELNPEASVVLAELTGHGHISGADGKINPDLSNITTARHMFKGIVIETE